jgi:hypothetical protein
MKNLATILLLISSAVACAPESSPDESPASALARLLRCNDEAVGGDALRRVARVEVDLAISEPTFDVEATYVATREGIARIDVFSDGERVFSEGWDGTTGWQQPRGAPAPVPTSPEGGEALRHGLEQPGHLWTLSDMEGNGHAVTLSDEDEAEDAADGVRVVHLTLRDGFEAWYWVDTTTCLVERSRNFRAFHPDVQPDETWIETRFADYRRTDGVARAWLSVSVDLATGDTLGVTRVEAVRHTPTGAGASGDRRVPGAH